MAHLFQVGAGSGGMTVLDIVCRDSRITHVTLVEPDVFKSHNVIRHQFPFSSAGQLKADLASEWLRERRPDLAVETIACDLTDSDFAERVEPQVSGCDIGICAADNERAKFHFDMLMRRHRKPWTLGEVDDLQVLDAEHGLNDDGFHGISPPLYANLLSVHAVRRGVRASPISLDCAT